MGMQPAGRRHAPNAAASCRPARRGHHRRAAPRRGNVPIHPSKPNRRWGSHHPPMGPWATCPRSSCSRRRRAATVPAASESARRSTSCRPLLRWFHSSSSLDCGPPPCSQCDTIGPRLSSSALLQSASLLATPATSRCPLRQRLSRWTAGGRVVPAHLCTFGRASSGTCQFCCGLMRTYLWGR